MPSYADVAAPVTATTPKNAHFRWGTDEQDAFEAVKDALCSDRVVMRHPDPSKPYILHTDASDFTVGAILTQKDDSGIDRPIQYISKTPSESQRKWAAIVKEAFAIVSTLNKLQPYLQSVQLVVYGCSN